MKENDYHYAYWSSGRMGVENMSHVELKIWLFGKSFPS